MFLFVGIFFIYSLSLTMDVDETLKKLKDYEFEIEMAEDKKNYLNPTRLAFLRFCKQLNQSHKSNVSLDELKELRDGAACLHLYYQACVELKYYTQERDKLKADMSQAKL